MLKIRACKSDYKKLDVIVVGTGRCGTGYMAKLLTGMGVSCGHESIFTFRGIEEAKFRLLNPNEINFSHCMSVREKTWAEPQSIVADSSYMSAPFLRNDLFDDAKIIHIIRNPIDVINSFATDVGYFTSNWIYNDFERFIEKHLPVIYKNDYDAINRAALYFLQWNDLIFKNCQGKKHIVFKIENSKKDSILNFLSKKQSRYVSSRTNSWDQNKLKFSIKHLSSKIQNRIIDFCKKYKYEIIF